MLWFVKEASDHAEILLGHEGTKHASLLYVAQSLKQSFLETLDYLQISSKMIQI